MGAFGCQENDSPDSTAAPSVQLDSSNNSTATPLARLQLPGSSLIDHCVSGKQITGGDLMAFADRIVVGEVVSIEFVEEFQKMDGRHVPSDDECRPSSYTWALKINLDVNQNLKGTGDGLVVYVTPEELNWDSLPMRRVNGDWLPAWPDHNPAVELSDDFAWTESGGIQEGQTLLLFTLENQAGISRTIAPWALKEAERFSFQLARVECEQFPQVLTTPFTLDDLTEELTTAATHGFVTQRNQMKSSTRTPTSYCITGEIERIGSESDAGTD